MLDVLLIDDHQLIIDGLSAFIERESDLQVVGVGKNGREALHLSRLFKPQLVMMDIDMPVMNGLDATKALKQSYPQIRVLMLSLHLERHLIQRCAQVGADGYLHKDADKAEVLHAIRTVGKGKPYFSGQASMILAGQHPQPPTPSKISSAVYLSQLSPRELEVLRATAEGYSSKEIGEQLHISSRTVETHRRNLMQKLEVDRLAGLIRLAVQWGLIS